MLTPKQIGIYEAFLRTPYRELTFKDIKEHAKEKSNSLVQNAVARFLAERIVSTRKVGNVNLYRANLNNSATHSYFAILIKDALAPAVHNSIDIVKDELAGTPFCAILIFGSYAEGTQTKGSDLDIAVFVKSAEEKKSCELALKSATLKSVLPIDAHAFTYDEMLQMLKDRHENLGKQIARKHLAVQNPEIITLILKEGINNGLNLAHP